MKNAIREKKARMLKYNKISQLIAVILLGMRQLRHILNIIIPKQNNIGRKRIGLSL